MKTIRWFLLFLTLALGSVSSLKQALAGTSDQNCTVIVTAGGVHMSQARVCLYWVDPLDSMNLVQDTCFWSFTGEFFIPMEKLYRPFLFYVVPELKLPEFHYPEYFPTYLGDQYHWKNATIDSLNIVDTTVFVSLVKRPSIFLGNQNLRGTVSSGKYADSDVAGACVLLLDLELQPLKYQFLDADRSFAFLNIPPGNYYILIDKVGIDDILHPLSISSHDPDRTIALTVNESGGSTGVEDALKQGSHIHIFPNQITHWATIAFDQPIENHPELKIINASGRVVRSVCLDVSNNRAQVDFSGLPNGMYLVKMGDYTFRVQKINR